MSNQEAAPASGTGARARRVAARLNLLFFVAVLLPTLLAAGYYGLVASDVYISESRFVVRSPQRPAQSGLGALLQGTVFSRSQDDTYSVHDFIRSRDALRELDAKLGMRLAFEDVSIDWMNRFPGARWWDDSFEALHEHYLRHVAIEYDTVSSISVLRVRAYSPQSAEAVNRQLLEMGERLVNTMNIRSRQDLIQVAEQEVLVAEERAKAAAAKLSAFRADRSVFDPDRQGLLQLQSVSKLREELLAVQAQLDQVRRVAPTNPQVPALEARIALLRQSIEQETARVVGSDRGLMAKSPVLDRLTLEKAFADRQLAGALAALDTARNEAARKQLYLERLVQPHVPDSAVEPRRVRAVVTVFFLGLVAWGILTLIMASVKEHAD